MGKIEKVIINTLHPKKGFKCLILTYTKRNLMDELSKAVELSGEVWGLYDAALKPIKSPQDKKIQKYVNVRIYEASPLDIPSESEYFDCVIGIEILNLFSNRDRLFQEIFRVLKSLGRFLLVEPSNYLKSLDLKTDLLVMNFQDILMFDFKKWLIFKKTLIEATKP